MVRKEFLLTFLSLSTAIGLALGCDCGKESKRQSKYKGSMNAQLRFPWLVQIVIKSPMTAPIICSGTLITSNYIVTSMGCIHRANQNIFDRIPIKVYFSTHSQTTPSKGIVKKVYYTENSITGYPDRDLAIIEMETSVREGRKLNRICLPSIDEEEALLGQKLTIAGWNGTMKLFPEKPVAANLDYITQAECNKLRSSTAAPTVKPDLELCGFDLENKKGNCPGDIGSPVMWRDPETNRWILVGIVSNTSDCKMDDQVSSFTSVFRFLREIIRVYPNLSFMLKNSCFLHETYYK